MRIALFVGARNVLDALNARQISWQTLVAFLRLATFVLRNDVRFFSSVRQAVCRVGRVTEVDPQLIGRVHVALTLGGETFSLQLQVVPFRCLEFCFELLDHVVALRNFFRPLRNFFRLLRNDF
jgi:hypothetical protein